MLLNKMDKSNSSSELTTEVGTLRYMAPEIKTGKYNNLVDIYSCGILLYELFTNNLYVDKFNWNKNLPNDLIKLINIMTDENPEGRINASLALNEFLLIEFHQNLFKNFRIKF